MDKAAKTRQRAHKVRRQNEKRKQGLKEASEAYRYVEAKPQYRPFTFAPTQGAELSIAAMDILFARMLR